MLWLATHVPLLGLETQLREAAAPAELAGADELAAADEPAVLLEQNRVVLLNEAALRLGLTVGISLATAHGVAPGLAHFTRDETLERRRLRFLASIGYRYSPRVSLAPPDALLLDVGGSETLFGGLTAIMDELDALFRRHGHSVRLAAAETPPAALLLARAGLPGLPGDARSAVRRAPLACTELKPQQVERLANMGIFHVGQLLELPADEGGGSRRSGGGAKPLARASLARARAQNELGRRFEETLVDYLDRLTGHKADLRAPDLPPERFQTSIHLLAPVRGKQALLFPMRRLAGELADWLTARQQAAASLVWQMASLAGRRSGGKPTIDRGRSTEASASFEVRFATPCAKAGTFMALSRLRLDQETLPAEVMSIHLHAGRTTSTRPEAVDLLDPRAAGDSSPGELADTLAAKLGDAAVCRLRQVADHRPEHAWTTRPPAAFGGPRANQAPRPAPTAGVIRAPDPARAPDASRAPEAARPPDAVRPLDALRPLWLLDEPLPVAPEEFDLDDGPERIGSGWWDASVARDYYVATAKSGARCWLYRDRHGGWHLHGYFG